MNTPYPCNECIHLCYDALQKDTPNHPGECDLNNQMGNEQCNDFKKGVFAMKGKKPDGCAEESNQSNHIRSNSHIILYAKGHYEELDVWQDLRRIISKTYFIEQSSITDWDIFIVVVNTVSDFCMEVKVFLPNLFANNNFEEDSLVIDKTNLLKMCLSELKYVNIPLPEPDSSILPLKKHQKQEIILYFNKYIKEYFFSETKEFFTMGNNWESVTYQLPKSIQNIPLVFGKNTIETKEDLREFLKIVGYKEVSDPTLNFKGESYE